MAKLFYTPEEAAAKLGKTVDQVKDLAREGRLETFHQDGQDLFRVSSVDQLAEDDLGLDNLELPPDLGSGLDNLADLDLSDLPPLTDAPLNIDEATPSVSSGRASRDLGPKDDFGDDLGMISLEDSSTLEPAAPARGGATGAFDLGGDLGADLGDDPFGDIGLAESGSAHGGSAMGAPVGDSAGLGGSGGTSPGGAGSPGLSDSSINFGVADAEDPHLETVGSGSGLLDLTRESEDTSIGAAMLEEEFDAAGGSGSGGLEGLIGDDHGGLGGAELPVGEAPAPVVGGALAGAGLTLVPAYDGAWSGLSVGAMLGAFLALVVCLLVSSATIFGGSSAFLADLSENLWIVTGSVAGVVAIGMGIGFFVGRATE